MQIALPRPQVFCALALALGASPLQAAEPVRRDSEWLLNIGRMPSAPVLDGKLEDWPAQAATILLGEARHTLPRPGQWDGTRDLSGAVRLAWDEDYLYLAAEVADDNLMQAKAEGGEPWQGDSLELFFNVAPGQQRTPCFRQVAVVPPLEEGAALATVCPQGNFPAVEGKAVREPNGYVLECRIPWANLKPFAARPGGKLGFQIMLDDRDKKGRKSQLCWFPSAITYAHPMEMGVVQLAEQPSPPAHEVLAGPTASCVTDASAMAFSVVTITPGATKARLTLQECLPATGFAAERESLPPVEIPLAAMGGALFFGEGKYPLAGNEGTARFLAEVLDDAGKVLASHAFETELAGKRYAEMRGTIKALEARLAALPASESLAEPRAGVGFWLQRCKGLAANEARPESVRVGMLEDLRAELREIGGAIGILEKGGDPYAGRMGSFVRAYRSPLTGEFRPHALYVPADYRPGQPKPMIVVLHGIFGDDRHLFQMLGDVRHLGAIVYQAASYRQFDWSDISAAETWAGLEDVMKDYTVDPDRIYLMGHHIGGRGTLQLAEARPGFFAAAAAMYPGVDTKPRYPALAVYPEFAQQALESGIPYPVFKKPDPPEPLAEGVQKRIYERLSLAAQAENLAGLPMKLVVGEADPDAAAERLALLERCRNLGLAIPVDYVPGAMHGNRPAQLQDPAFYQWLLAQKRQGPPPDFTYVCVDLRNNRGWFIRVDGLASPVEPGRVAASRRDGKIALRTRGVTALTPVVSTEGLGLSGRVELTVDGQSVFAGKPDDLPSLHLVKSENGQWTPGKIPDGSKRHGLSGPIDDFQFGRFLYVYGTGGSPQERADLEKATRKLANRGLGAEFPVKADTEVTANDIQDCHLVLTGTPASNSLLARMSDQLPLRWNGETMQLGALSVQGPEAAACVISPDPLNPQRYVVVLSSQSPKAYRVWEARAGADFVLGRVDEKSGEFQVSALGRFGNDWKLRPDSVADLSRTKAH